VAQTARAATASAPNAGSYSGTLSGVTGDQIANSPAYQQAYAQTIARFGPNPSARAIQFAQTVATEKAYAAMVRESASPMRANATRIKPLPLRHLVDKESTLWHWRLDESLDRRRGGLQFNRRGIGHVFQLIEQQLVELDVKGARAQDVMARRGKASQRPAATIAKPAAGAPPAAAPAAQPGQRIEPTFNPAAAAPAAPAPQAAAEPPEYLRPTRPGAPVQQPAKPGLMSRIGQGLQTFGRQLTTKVTAEKLNTNWKVAGSPTDSDKLFAFLIQQGVPDAVARQVYGTLKLQAPPATAGATSPAAGGAATVPYAPPVDTGTSAAPGGATGSSAAGAASKSSAAQSSGTSTAPATAGDPAAAASGQSGTAFAQRIRDQFTEFEQSGGNPWSTVVMKTLQDLIYQGELARRKLGESRKRIQARREIKRTIREVRQKVNSKRARAQTI